ncbi:MAG: glycosyltransferase family 4 protein [Synechococcales cyanobacterium C42_A2020_086]|nr:glycosyltransferase family 4 protein [Synechococcales cyanobacterium C42_A2020_086]
MTSLSTASPWICCQLGAREHYAIPRALHQSGNLALLLTDAWVKPHSLIHAIHHPFLKSLQERFHPDLVHAPVQSFTPSLSQFELIHRYRKTNDWDRMIARNRWFQARALRELQKAAPRIVQSGTCPVLFTYSYAALDLLRYAKSLGWYTILGQIDPGMMEEKIVLEEHRKHPDLAPAWQPVPSDYWSSWQEECRLADRIVVNSSWSSQALQQVGVPADKIQIVPLAYSPPQGSESFQRVYPEQFSRERPLRVLFLGQIILRKGIAALLEAAELLQDQPIEFWLVGSIGVERSRFNLPNIRLIGPVPRSETAQYYQQADVFLFPTLSDGFGLTQLEAQAWKLPLIVSRFCGEVVKDGVNGIVLPEVNGKAVADVIQYFLQHPEHLIFLSKKPYQADAYSLPFLGQKLCTGSV